MEEFKQESQPNPYNQNVTQDSSIPLDLNGQKHLGSAAGWAMAIGVLIMIGAGITLLGALFIVGMGSILESQMGGMSPIPMGMISVVYLLMGLVYFIPGWFIIRFSQQARAAVLEKNAKKLNSALLNLKRNFASIIIMFVAFIVLYIILIAVIMSSGFMNNNPFIPQV